MRVWNQHRQFAAAVVAASFAVSLGAAEAVVRWVRPSPYYGYRYTRPQQKLFEYDPVRGWRGRPNTSEIFAGHDFAVRVTHNRLGHRSTTEPYVEGKINVIVVGDSFGWGWGVEDQDVFSERMMQLDSRYNVYNLASPAYGTDQSYLALKDLLDQYPDARFDHVIALAFGNDFSENETTTARGLPKPMFVLEGAELQLTNTPVPETMRREFDLERRLEFDNEPGWLSRSHLYNLLWLSLQSRPDEDGPPPSLQSEQDLSEEQSARLAFALLDAMREASEERGAKLTVIRMFPSESDSRWRYLRRMTDEAGVNSATFYPWSIFRTTLWLDGHLNEHGNRLLAETALKTLAAGGP